MCSSDLKVAGATVTGAQRRAKYLLFPLTGGALEGGTGRAPGTPATLLVHLGMSGNLRVLPAATPRLTHDHFDLVLDSGETLRFNDPRRFGSLHLVEGDPAEHPLLRHLGPEPLERLLHAAEIATAVIDDREHAGSVPSPTPETIAGPAQGPRAVPPDSAIRSG